MYFPRRPVSSNKCSVTRSSNSNNSSSRWQSKMVAAAATLTALSSTGARFTAERARSFFPAAAASSVPTTAFMVPSVTPNTSQQRQQQRSLHTVSQEQVLWPPQRQRQSNQQRQQQHIVYSPPTLSSTQRLYHSNPRPGRGGFHDDGKDESPVRGLLSKAKNVAKKFLPQKWFLSDEERRRAEETELIRQEVKGSLQQIFKDAPLPIRMLGQAIAPLLANLMNVAAETMAEQKTTVDAVVQQAQACLSADETVARALGGTSVTVGTPFSQASSSSSVNGQTQVRVELALPVTAVGGGATTVGLQQPPGIARVVATGDGKSEPILQLLEVQVQGRVIAVSTTPRRGSSSSSTTTSGRSGRVGDDDDNIIEAEIIEEKRKRL